MAPKVPMSEIRGRLAVITITKNDLDGLEHTLDSAKAQTNQDFRHLVIDSSTNPTDVENLVSKYRAEYHWHPPNGIYPAMEFGLEKLGGSDYCWFMNSSDTFGDSNSVELVSRRLFQETRNDITWALGRVLLVGEKEPRIYSATLQSDDLLATARRGRIYFPHSSTIIEVSSLRLIDPFAENLKIAQDYLIALKVLTRFGPPIVFEEVLSHFVLGGVTSQKTVRTGLETVKARVMVFGVSQIPREFWNVIRIVAGRPIKKMQAAISSKFSSW